MVVEQGQGKNECVQRQRNFQIPLFLFRRNRTWSSLHTVFLFLIGLPELY